MKIDPPWLVVKELATRANLGRGILIGAVRGGFGLPRKSLVLAGRARLAPTGCLLTFNETSQGGAFFGSYQGAWFDYHGGVFFGLS